MWTIEYRETEPRTIVRTPEGKDIPARGRLWVDPTTGRILMTELILGDPGLRTAIDVSYQSEPLVGFLVPAGMRERYLGPNLIVTGSATYRNFRQFSVQVDEKAAPLVR